MDNDYLHNSYRKIPPLHLMEEGIKFDVGHIVLEKNDVEQSSKSSVGKKSNATPNR